MSSPINQIRTRVLQKLGKAEKSERPEEYDTSREYFGRVQKHVDKAVKVTKSFCQRGESASKSQTELGEFFVEAGLQDKTDIGEAMIRMGETIKSLAMIQHSMNVNIVEKFVRPNMDFHEEFNAGNKLHKKYNKRTLEYDTQRRTIAQLKNKKEPDNQKIATATEDLSRIEDARNDAFIEAEYEINRMEHKSRTDYVLYMCDLFYSFHNYFAECYTMSSDLKEYVDTVRDNAASQKDQKIERKPAPEKASFSSALSSPRITPPARDRSTSNGDTMPVSVSVTSAATSYSGGGGDGSISAPTFVGLVPGSARASAASGGIGQCTALYDYTAQDKTEISFNEGDVITVLTKADDGWYMGEINGQKGLFPSTYCSEIGSAANGGRTSGGGSGGGSRTVIALYDYDATDEGELSFHEGDRIVVVEESDSGWWTGKLNGVTGTFPSNYTDAA